MEKNHNKDSLADLKNLIKEVLENQEILQICRDFSRYVVYLEDKLAMPIHLDHVKEGGGYDTIGFARGLIYTIGYSELKLSPLLIKYIELLGEISDDYFSFISHFADKSFKNKNYKETLLLNRAVLISGFFKDKPLDDSKLERVMHQTGLSLMYMGGFEPLAKKILENSSQISYEQILLTLPEDEEKSISLIRKVLSGRNNLTFEQRNHLVEILKKRADSQDFERARHLFYASRYQESKEILLSIEESFYDHYEYNFMLGVIYRSQEEYEKALEYQLLSLSQNSAQFFALTEAGILCILTEDLSEAKRFFNEAYKISDNTNRGDALLNIAIANYHLGDSSEANRYLDLALSHTDSSHIKQWERVIRST